MVHGCFEVVDPLFQLVLIIMYFRSLRFARHFTRYARNDQIFLHDVGGRYAATLSKASGAVPIGYSPSEEIKIDTFNVNLQFMEILNKVLHSSIDKDFTFIMEAGVNASTYMPIYDFREIPRFGRTPSPDDVFGYVLVDENGKMVQGSYQSNEMYRVCNGNGLIKLSDYMLEQMREATQP